jgi:hypothetical protein
VLRCQRFTGANHTMSELDRAGIEAVVANPAWSGTLPSRCYGSLDSLNLATAPPVCSKYSTTTVCWPSDNGTSTE